MTNYNNWDVEAEMADMFKLFDPEDMSEWRKYSPEEFLAMMILEIRQRNEKIQAWSELMAKIPEFSSQTFQLNNHEITAKFFLWRIELKPKQL
jgi:hypothetical protein